MTMKKKATKKRAKKKVEALGEIDACAVIERAKAQIRAGTLSANTILDLAEALRERLPFDCGEVVGDFSEEYQGRAAQEVSDLCCLIAYISGDRVAFGIEAGAQSGEA